MNRPKQQPLRRDDGTVLLIVLWVIALLSFMLITTMMVMKQRSDAAQSEKLIFRARQLAEKGAALASHPDVKRSDPLLRQRFSDTERFEARVSTEEARLNLNMLLTEPHLPALKQLFIRWGFTAPEADTLVDHLMDWIDTDNLRRLRGAERSEYEAAGISDSPANARFTSIEQVGMVLGMEVLTELRPSWKEDFTLIGSGRFDLNEASAPLMADVLNITPMQAQSLVEWRAGPDGIERTEDDTLFTSVDEALSIVGLDLEDMPEIGPLLTIRGQTKRIVSLGYVADYVRGLSVVFAGETAGARLMQWREFVPEEFEIPKEPR